jgi:hypothetical protein
METLLDEDQIKFFWFFVQLFHLTIMMMIIITTIMHVIIIVTH